ncbi:MAG: hypothetical protein IJ859_07220 [Synergistaceae bacterium]|nr:hypothetical protein [Synergistaceae bacterium]
MAKKAKRTTKKKKQWRSILPWIGHIAAAAYWLIRLVLLLVDWFNK